MIIYGSPAYIYLEIPKNGSRSVVKAIKNKYGTNHCEGHKSLSYVLQWCSRKKITREFEAVAILRNPYERFLSGINYVHQNKPRPIADHIKHGLEGKQRYGKVFTTQLSWIDSDEVPVHYFTNLSDGMRFMGLPPIYHENKSVPHYKMSDLGPHMDFIECTYAEDIQKWNTLLGTRYE